MAVIPRRCTGEPSRVPLYLGMPEIGAFEILENCFHLCCRHRDQGCLILWSRHYTHWTLCGLSQAALEGEAYQDLMVLFGWSCYRMERLGLDSRSKGPIPDPIFAVSAMMLTEVANVEVFGETLVDLEGCCCLVVDMAGQARSSVYWPFHVCSSECFRNAVS